jgi:hypothetical protein
MAQLQHTMWVTNARSAALSIITGGGKWIEMNVPADALNQHFLGAWTAAEHERLPATCSCSMPFGPTSDGSPGRFGQLELSDAMRLERARARCAHGADAHDCRLGHRRAGPVRFFARRRLHGQRHDTLGERKDRAWGCARAASYRAEVRPLLASTRRRSSTCRCLS